MTSKQSNRRRFLKETAALAGLAAGAARLGDAQTQAGNAGEGTERDLHAYGERSRFVTSTRLGTNGNSERFRKGKTSYQGGPRSPLQDQVGIITPTSLHYIVNHSYETLDIDPREHRLLIHGLVDRPMVFTVEELKRLPSVSRIHFVECRANGNPNLPQRRLPDATVQLTHGLTSCSEWTGVPLSLLLKEAGLKSAASWILAEGADQPKHTKSIPIEKAMDDVLVAYGQNGEAVRPEQGYPLRLLVPGWQGINGVKWLRRIKLVDQPYMTRAETTQYVEARRDGTMRWFMSEFGPNSVITRPSGGQRLPGRGFYEITGLAWSGGGIIKRVEISTDGGKTWKDAQIQGPVHRKAHTRFSFAWNWNGEEHRLQSRSTEEGGGVQPTVAGITKFLNLGPENFRPPAGMIGNFNAIQTWKVNRDGSVENALFS